MAYKVSYLQKLLDQHFLIEKDGAYLLVHHKELIITSTNYTSMHKATKNGLTIKLKHLKLK